MTLSLSNVLLIAAVACVLIAAAFDFGAIDSSDPHVLGWVALGLAFGFGSKLAVEV